MARRFQRLSLQRAILGTFTLALVIVLGALFFLLPAQVENFLEQRVVQRGRVIARTALGMLEVAPRGTIAPPPAGALEGLVKEEPSVRFAAILAPDGTLIANTLVLNPTEIIALARQYELEGYPVELPAREFQDLGEIKVIADQRFDNAQTPTARILVGLSLEDTDRVVSGLRFMVLIAFLIGLILCVGLVWLLSRVFLIRPLNNMLEVAGKLSQADLTGQMEASTSDELGTLAEALNGIGQSLRDTLGRVRGVSESLTGVIEQISRTGTTVSSGAGTIQGRVEETSASMVQMMASLRGIAENVEVLYQSAEESSSSIMEMAATNDEVAENVQAMAKSVEETTSAIEQMTYSIKEVARNIESLSASSEETSSAMAEMDASIGQVETNANETARLAEQVQSDADTGVESLRKTLTGIDRIKETSRSASEVIERLGGRISEIGNILNVIDDVAEQTNLLALNAAIIAAQAGEHGKGFAVVAEEIKDLAERTGASTKEIAELIRGVQQESQNAVNVMDQGVRNVEEGVQLGREAEGALRKIYESANKATQMVKAIARATVEQSRGSKAVTGAILRINDTVQQIAKASNEQARGTEQIMKSAERMKAITQHVQRSSQEQAHGSKQITRSIESINEMVTHLNRAQKEQTKGSEQVLGAVEAIKGISEHQTRSVRQLEEAIEALQRQAEVLRAEVRRFRV